MGIWDIYCVICGAPLWNQKIHTVGPVKEYSWLDDVYIVTSRETIITSNDRHSAKYFGHGEVVIGNQRFAISSRLWHKYPQHYTGYGVACHRNCYRLVDKVLKHKLQFANVSRRVDKWMNTLRPSLYGKMKEYMGQFFNFVQAHRKNSWLLQDPMKNKRNRSRILVMWRPYVQRFSKKTPRPSPSESASNFNVDTVLYGYDNLKWIVVARIDRQLWARLDTNKPMAKPKTKSMAKTRARGRTKSRTSSRK